MKLIKVFLLLLFFAMLLILVPLVSAQEDQEPNWPSAYEEQGEEEIPPGAGYHFTMSIPPPASGTPASITYAHLEDASGIVTDKIIGDESFYLVIQVNQAGRLYVVEYYPSGAIPPWHWLMSRVRLSNGGTWTIGPFIPESSEPQGQHAWKMRFYAPNALYGETVLRFEYYREAPKPPPTDVPTSVTVSSSTASIKAGDTVSVFGILNPMTGGSVTIEESKDGVTWSAIGSGPATSMVTAQCKPDKPGTYFVRAKYDGYLDTTANKNYLPSQSAPVSLQVMTKNAWVIPLAIGLGIVAAGAIGFFVWRRLAKKPIKAG